MIFFQMRNRLLFALFKLILLSFGVSLSPPVITQAMISLYLFYHFIVFNQSKIFASSNL